MAKGKFTPGLAPGFEIKVSAEDLFGAPATLGDYLDDDADSAYLARLKQKRNETVARRSITETKPQVVERAPLDGSGVRSPKNAIESRNVVEMETVPPPPQSIELAPVGPTGTTTSEESPQRIFRTPLARRRLQINLSPDAERKVLELLDLIRDRGSEKNIMFNDLIHGLVFSLYEARNELNLSAVPARGKWGGTMAKAFPFALAKAFGSAVTRFFEKQPRDSYQKVVGG